MLIRQRLLTYALNNEGKLVYVDNVANGNNCECICPYCKGELCAKNGGNVHLKAHHFAHQSGAECEGAIESALHKMAKDVLYQTRCIMLPPKKDDSFGGLLQFDKIIVEPIDKETGLRPDCVGYYGDKFIWIEFKKTHAVDYKKKGKIISAKIDCIEIDLTECQLDPEAVRAFISGTSKKRKWIVDNECRPRAGAAHSYFLFYEVDENEKYKQSRLARYFCKDENGTFVNLQSDDVDVNKHSYYCLSCNGELTIDVDNYGTCSFVHMENGFMCDDESYLRKAAKAIIRNKFLTSEKFEIILPQYSKCSNYIYDQCKLYQLDKCKESVKHLYDLNWDVYTG